MITGTFIDSYEQDSPSYQIRKSVFIDELECDSVFLMDEMDKSAYHLLIKDGDLAVGCGRIILDEQKSYIGRIAVMASHRGQSIGDLIVRMLLDRAFRLGLEPIHVYARLNAIPFYERIGFKSETEPYFKEGVEVVDMHITCHDLKRYCND